MTRTLIFKVACLLVVFMLLFNIVSILFSSNSDRITFTYCLEKFSEYNNSNQIDFSVVFNGLKTALDKMTIDATGDKIVDGLISFVNSFSNMLIGSCTFICYGAIFLYSLCTFGYWLWASFV